tara:strand:+ start:17843 stop:18505 length:663 start_codon:yes stop_codon:yes gene_type:complete
MWYDYTMRRISLAIATSAIMAALALSPPASPPEQWRDAIVHTVRVECDRGGGTGVPVECVPLLDGRWSIVILTAKHVVEGEDLSLWWISTPEMVYGVPTLMAEHPTADASLLRIISDEPLNCTPLRFAHPDMGEQVWVIGYPSMSPHRVITDGWVGGVGVASAEVFPGNSGGPVVDSFGHLVGIVVTVGVHGHPMDPKFIHHDMGFLPLGAIQEWLVSNL